MDQELADAAAYAPGRHRFCTHQMAALFAWNDIMAAILKVWDQIDRIRQSMRIYSKNIIAKFNPDPIWNDGGLGFFEEVAPTRTGY